MPALLTSIIITRPAFLELVIYRKNILVAAIRAEGSSFNCRQYAWRKADDFALLAVNSQTQQPVGAIWIRLMTGDAKGYGYVDEQTPELSIAMLPEYCGLGLGTRLMTQLIEASQNKYPALSLSVSADNPARRLYERLGFETVKEAGDSITMKLTLKNQR